MYSTEKLHSDTKAKSKGLILIVGDTKRRDESVFATISSHEIDSRPADADEA